MPKKKAQGHLNKPPRKPPTAIGTSFPSGSAGDSSAIQTGNLAAFSGPRGSGKSTLAFFTALAWSLLKNRQTLFATFDMAAWKDLCSRYKLGQSPVLVELARPSLSARVIAGGPGVISVGPKVSRIVGLPQDVIWSQLGMVSRSHDIFFDVDRRSILEHGGSGSLPLEGPVLKKCENIFWTVDSSDPDALATSQADFQRLAGIGVPLHHFHVVLNDLHGKGQSPESGALKKLLGQVGKSNVVLVERFPVDEMKLPASCVNALREILRLLERSNPAL